MPNISLRLPRTGTGRGTAALSTALAIVVLTAAVLGWDMARADDQKITGKPVSDVQLAAVLSAAHSCPMLSSARLAGQMMAESGLNTSASGTVSGGSGIAGQDDEDWKKWAPWAGAPRTDTTASTLALAHQMCGLSGELRLAGVTGDPWRLALAAYRSGVPAVTAAGGVPEEARQYVDESAGYAAYYEDLPQFGAAGATEVVAAVAGDTPDAQPLPDEYVPFVAEAGRVCPEVTPAAVAAELMAASGFDARKIGEAGRQGVAQFRMDVWSEYAPPGASVWEPGSAIPTFGTVLCALTEELDGLGGDPYATALAAFHAGPDTVRRAGGLPDAMTRAFLGRVTDYTEYYRLDSRLGTPVAPTPGTGSPSASGSAGPSATPSATPSPTPGTPAKAAPPAATQGATNAPAPAPPPLPGQQIQNSKTKKCVDAGAATDGVIMTVTECNPTSNAGQRWDVRSDGTVRSFKTGLCLDVAWAKVDNNVKVQTAVCNGTAAQQWTIADNTLYTGLDSNYCLDLNESEAGLPVVIWWCVHHAKQSWTVKR